MKLNSLRIEQLRQFRKPLEIRDLQPGINLFCGPNESGKSTLVRAIRAAFFERHSTTSVGDMQPWGDSSTAPQVMLDFDCQGKRWRLEKRFLSKKRCDLQIDSQSCNGEEAEEKLAELLGFQYSGRGASKAEHWGIPGLLWIEQGAGQEIREAVAHAGNHLKSALGTSLGEVASSTGDQLIGTVERQRAALLTQTGRPTGELAETSAQQARLQETLQALNDKIATYQQQVDRLGELRRLDAGDEAERPWEHYRQQAEIAQQQLTEVDGWVSEQQREQTALRACQSTLQLLRDQLSRFEAQASELQQREQAHAQAQARVATLDANLPAVSERVTAAAEAYRLARQALAEARQHEQRLGIEKDCVQLERQLQDLTTALAKARQVQADLLELRRQAQASRIAPAQLTRLKQAHEQLAHLKIRQEMVATRLQFDLQPGQSLQLDGQPLSGQGERLLLEAASLEVAGVGRLRIQPGGQDLAELTRQQERLTGEVTALLHELAVDSLAQAEERAGRFQTLQAEITGKEGLLASHATRGIEVLDAEQQEYQVRLQALRDRLLTMPCPEGEVVSLAEAEALVEATSGQLVAAEREQSDHDRERALAAQAVNGAAAELQRLTVELQSPERRQREAQARQQLIDLRADEERLKRAVEERARQIAAAQPEILRQDIQRFGATAEQLEKAARQRKLELASLQSALETQGAQGLEEQQAELAQELARTQRRHAELKRRAEALDLLLGLLREKRQALTRRLQAPLQKHLNRYVQLLFPQASLEVDENLIPSQLIRTVSQGQEVGAYDALSFGAREQMGLISRLAYADLLKEAGRPTLIILDDALVHSDHSRLDQMKRILFDAAQRHQILLFTCHPDHWRDLGVAAQDLRALKATA